MIEQASLVLGNGNWAVKSDSLLGYKTIDGKYYPREFTFTRATTGTRVNEAGLVELVPYNFVQYSQEFDNAVWDKLNGSITANTAISPSGVQDADNFIPSATSGAHALRSNFVNTTTTTSYSFFVKANGYTKVSVRESQTSGSYASFDLSNGTLLDTNQSGYIENYGNGWYRCTLIDTVFGTVARSGLFVLPPSYTSGDPVITWLPNGTSGVFVWGAQLVEGTEPLDYLPTTDRLDIARIDYSTGEPALLVEPQRTNLLLRSEEFENASWAKVNTVITANSTISPNGTLTADTLTDDATNGVHRINNATALTVVSGTTYTYSCFVKNIDINFVILKAFAGNNFAILIDLVTKSVTSTVGAISSKIDIYDDWIRCQLTFISNSTTATMQVATSNGIIDVVGNSNYIGTGKSTYIWGAQLEAGDYATSYIPTTTASVTRNRDQCVKTGATALIGQTEGTIFVEMKALVNGGTGRTISLSDGTTQNRITIEDYSSADFMVSRVTSANVQEAFMVGSPFPQNIYRKIAVKYKLNDCAFFINGVKVAFDTSVNMPISLSDLRFDSGAGSDVYNGNLKTLAIYKTALTDDECIQLTTL